MALNKLKQLLGSTKNVTEMYQELIREVQASGYEPDLLVKKYLERRIDKRALDDIYSHRIRLHDEVPRGEDLLNSLMIDMICM